MHRPALHHQKGSNRRADGQRMAGNGFGQAVPHHQYGDIDALVALDTGKEIQHPFIGYPTDELEGLANSAMPTACWAA